MLLHGCNWFLLSHLHPSLCWDSINSWRLQNYLHMRIVMFTREGFLGGSKIVLLSFPDQSVGQGVVLEHQRLLEELPPSLDRPRRVVVLHHRALLLLGTLLFAVRWRPEKRLLGKTTPRLNFFQNFKYKSAYLSQLVFRWKKVPGFEPNVFFLNGALLSILTSIYFPSIICHNFQASFQWILTFKPFLWGFNLVQRLLSYV